MPHLQWNDSSQVVNCCGKNKVLNFGDCECHPEQPYAKVNSLSTIAINNKYNVLVLVMFDNHLWWNSSLSNHLKDCNIFTSFPLSLSQFLDGNIKTDYSKFKKEIPTCFNDIDWLLPRDELKLYIKNWNCKKSFVNHDPICSNYNKCLSVVSSKLNTELQHAEHKIAELDKKCETMLSVE